MTYLLESSECTFELKHQTPVKTPNRILRQKIHNKTKHKIIKTKLQQTIKHKHPLSKTEKHS